MTSPNLNLGSLDDFDTVANAVGIAASQGNSAQDWINQQVDRVTGEVTGIVGWIADGLQHVVGEIIAFATSGDVRNLQAAAAYIESKISGFVFEVIEVVKDIFAALTNTYTGDDPTLLSIQAWRNSLFGWVDDVAQFIQNLLDAILRGIRGIPIVGGTIADIIAGVGHVKTEAATAFATAATAQTTATYTVLNIVSARPMYEALDPTADTSIDWSEVGVTTGASASTQSTTSTVARIAKIRIRQDHIKNTIGFVAANPSAGAMYIDLYRRNAEAAQWEHVHSSPNIGASVGILQQYVAYEFSAEGMPASAGETYAVQLRSSTTCNYAAKTLPVAPVPGLYPGTIGGARNPSGTPSPTKISDGTMETYNDGNTLYVELGSNFGQIDVPRRYYVTFDNYSWQTWVRNTNGGRLTIVDRHVERSGTSDGYQTATYGAQTLTDKMAVQFNVLSDSSQPTIMYMCRGNGSDAAPANAAFMGVKSDGIAIGNGATDRDSIGASDWRTGEGSYRLTYDPADNTFRGYKWDGTQWAELLTWTDSGNVVTHGPGKRYGGVAIYRTAFTNGAPLDEFVLEDW